MLDFFQWLAKEHNEDGFGLGIYPPAAGVGLYPSNYLMSTAPDAAFWLKGFHKKDAHFESGAEKKKSKHKHKKHKKK